MPILLTDAPAIAAELDDATLHVWRLRHDPRCGRAPLRALLACYLGLTPDAVTLVEGEHGRPQLSPAQGQTLDFNWSHSGDCALVAIGRGVAPGIDVERQRARPRALEIARRYFTPREAAWLAMLPAARRDEAFLALWTAKEAVMKALGRGLAFGLDRLEIGFDSGMPRLLRLESDDVQAWQLRALEIGAGHLATLAWRGSPRRIRLEVLACAT